MEPLSWNIILFGLKWIFMGLIYFVLGFVVLAVRREMGLRVKTSSAEADFSPGRLKVLSPGSDPKLRSGILLDLKPITMIGAQPDSDIVLRDRYISRNHARLRWDGVGWWIEDLGSRNGTYVNNEACPPNTPVKISNGATVSIGGTAFQLIE